MFSSKALIAALLFVTPAVADPVCVIHAGPELLRIVLPQSEWLLPVECQSGEGEATLVIDLPDTKKVSGEALGAWAGRLVAAATVKLKEHLQ